MRRKGEARTSAPPSPFVVADITGRRRGGAGRSITSSRLLLSGSPINSTAAHCLRLIDEEFARDQTTRARKELGRDLLGFAWSREWPGSWRGPRDVDSGGVGRVAESREPAIRVAGSWVAPASRGSDSASRRIHRAQRKFGFQTIPRIHPQNVSGATPETTRRRRVPPQRRRILTLPPFGVPPSGGSGRTLRRTA